LTEELMDNGFKDKLYGLVFSPLSMRMCEKGVAEDLNKEHQFCSDPADCADKWHYTLNYSRRAERMEMEDANGEPEPPMCP
jgi:hypothetical protein